MSKTVQARLNDISFDQRIERAVVSDEAQGRSDTEQILARVKDFDIPIETRCPDTSELSLNQKYRMEKSTLFLTVNKGSFIKPWESPPSIRGRDEWCLTPVEGCPFDCSYCYLQDYLDSPLIKTFVNLSDIPDHVREFVADPPEEPPHFFSLGELSDGLFLEPLLNVIPRIWELFKHKSLKVEVRSKSHHIHDLSEKIEPHSNGVFSWSLSPEGPDARDEMLTSGLEQRLSAMSRMLDRGFRVSARIDPILLRENWFDDYTQLIERMTDYLDLSDLTFLLLGVFRFPRGFDQTMEKRFSNRDFLKDQFVEGPDGKFRYSRGLRTDVYERLGNVIRDFGGDPSLCMEPGYVWEDAGFE